MENSKFIVVWAKIRGYPWWPGVIEIENSTYYKELPADSLYTVKFIGENSHSILNSKSIVDFEKFYEKHSLTSNKKLLSCISAARQLIEGDLSLSSLSSVNFEVKPVKPGKSPMKDLSSKLSKLQDLISKKSDGSCLDDPESPDIFQKHLSFLTEIVEHKCIEDSGICQLCEALLELVLMKININVLQDSRIQKILKTIAQVCRQSMPPIVKQLGHVIESLRKYWKGLMKPNQAEYDESVIADKSIRRIVCVKIANVFEFNHFDRKEARELALNIEQNLRKLDPTMTEKYKLYFRRMIKEIKYITPECYTFLQQSGKTER